MKGDIDDTAKGSRQPRKPRPPVPADALVFRLPISFGETALNPRLAAENAAKLLAAVSKEPVR